MAIQLRMGNQKAYDFLIESYYAKLCVYAHSLTSDRPGAEDIVQNVFVDVWAKRKNINPDLSLRNYLYRSVYNGFIDQYRKNKPVIYLEKKYLEALDTVVEAEQTNLDELMAKVNKEIEKLPPRCKEIFLLNKKEGLTHTEIAEHLNISTKTIEGHMTRAFRILGEKLGSKIKPILFLLFGNHSKLLRLSALGK